MPEESKTIRKSHRQKYRRSIEISDFPAASAVVLWSAFSAASAVALSSDFPAASAVVL